MNIKPYFFLRVAHVPYFNFMFVAWTFLVYPAKLAQDFGSMLVCWIPPFFCGIQKSIPLFAGVFPPMGITQPPEPNSHGTSHLLTAKPTGETLIVAPTGPPKKTSGGCRKSWEYPALSSKSWITMTWYWNNHGDDWGFRNRPFISHVFRRSEIAGPPCPRTASPNVGIRRWPWGKHYWGHLRRQNWGFDAGSNTTETRLNWPI